MRNLLERVKVESEEGENVAVGCEDRKWCGITWHTPYSIYYTSLPSVDTSRVCRIMTP
jgi:hypothetical protein